MLLFVYFIRTFQRPESPTLPPENNIGAYNKVVVDTSSVYSANDYSREMVSNIPKSPYNGSMRSADMGTVSPTSSKVSLIFLVLN